MDQMLVCVCLAFSLCGMISLTVRPINDVWKALYKYKMQVPHSLSPSPKHYTPSLPPSLWDPCMSLILSTFPADEWPLFPLPMSHLFTMEEPL